jgi:holo-[acyl-carrier protein] synthase
LIIGIGTDIVDIDRIAELVNQGDNKFLQRVFTEKESQYCQSKKRSAQHFAARFAAKEAILKALGTGFREVSWLDMEVANDHLGKPEVRLQGKVKELAMELGIANWHISLSHSENTAIAFCIAESK